MFLERANIRIQMTIGISIAVHILLLSLFGMQKNKISDKRRLTEVEFIEEIEETSQMEKLINKLAPPRQQEVREKIARAAENQLEQVSFSKVVGLESRRSETDQIDMSKLADLPQPDFDKSLEPLPEEKKVGPKIALVASRKSKQMSLESKVVALTDLPPANFDLNIQENQFQQPEQVIKQVKAERRKGTVNRRKKLNLKKSGFIVGEVATREIIRRASPSIPRWLEEKGVEVEVVLRFAVDPDGMVNERMVIEKTSGYSELDQLAMEALKKFIFVPLPLTAKQVEQKGKITIGFTFLK